MKNFNFKLLGISILSFYCAENSGWFRFFGAGLCWRNTDKFGLSFSERNGYEKYKIIGNWIVNFLPKN